MATGNAVALWAWDIVVDNWRVRILTLFAPNLTWSSQCHLQVRSLPDHLFRTTLIWSQGTTLWNYVWICHALSGESRLPDRLAHLQASTVKPTRFPPPTKNAPSHGAFATYVLFYFHHSCYNTDLSTLPPTACFPLSLHLQMAQDAPSLPAR